MSKLHAIWFVLSFVISYAANQVLAPSLDYAQFAEGPTLASGELIQSGGGRTTIKLVDLRVITADVDTTFGGTLPVRELILRGALDEGQTESDFEMFVNLAPEGERPVDPQARAFDELKGKPLPVLSSAIAKGPPSRVRLPGSDSAAVVKQGTLTLYEVLLLEPGVWRVRGDLDVELQQGDEVVSLFARLAGRVVWQ